MARVPTVQRRVAPVATQVDVPGVAKGPVVDVTQNNAKFAAMSDFAARQDSIVQKSIADSAFQKHQENMLKVRDEELSRGLSATAGGPARFEEAAKKSRSDVMKGLTGEAAARFEQDATALETSFGNQINSHFVSENEKFMGIQHQDKLDSFARGAADGTVLNGADAFDSLVEPGIKEVEDHWTRRGASQEEIAMRKRDFTGSAASSAINSMLSANGTDLSGAKKILLDNKENINPKQYAQLEAALGKEINQRTADEAAMTAMQMFGANNPEAFAEIQGREDLTEEQKSKALVEYESRSRGVRQIQDQADEETLSIGQSALLAKPNMSFRELQNTLRASGREITPRVQTALYGMTNEGMYYQARRNAAIGEGVRDWRESKDLEAQTAFGIGGVQKAIDSIPDMAGKLQYISENLRDRKVKNLALKYINGDPRASAALARHDQSHDDSRKLVESLMPTNKFAWGEDPKSSSGDVVHIASAMVAARSDGQGFKNEEERASFAKKTIRQLTEPVTVTEPDGKVVTKRFYQLSDNNLDALSVSLDNMATEENVEPLGETIQGLPAYEFLPKEYGQTVMMEAARFLPDSGHPAYNAAVGSNEFKSLVEHRIALNRRPQTPTVIDAQKRLDGKFNLLRKSFMSQYEKEKSGVEYQNQLNDYYSRGLLTK